MQTVSSYGVESTKTEYPDPPDTGDFIGLAVSYLTEIYAAGVGRTEKRFRMTKRRFNAAEHLVHTTKKELCPLCILTFASRRCHPTSAEFAIQHALGKCIFLQNTDESVDKSQE